MPPTGTTTDVPTPPEPTPGEPITSVVIAACRTCGCDGVGLHAVYGDDDGRHWHPLDGCAGLDRCGDKDPDLTVRVPISTTALGEAIDEVVGLIEMEDLTVAITLARSIKEWLPHLAPGAAGSDGILAAARKAVDERRATYGEPAELFATVARRWSILLGQPITPAQATLMMIDLKLARLTRDPAHRDSLVDVAGYTAILGEIAAARPAVVSTPSAEPHPAGPRPPGKYPW